MARVAPASTSAFARGVAVVPRVQTLRAARAELVVKVTLGAATQRLPAVGCDISRALSLRFARIVRVVPQNPLFRSFSPSPQAEKLCLDNLSPQDGARRGKVRRCRGYGGHKGGTGGRGNRGQKSRSGASIRPGFEGGQMPLYRRLPKLKGIAGGMGAGLPDNVVINLADLNAFEEGAEVSLDSLKACRKLNTSGREDKLPLKVSIRNSFFPLHRESPRSPPLCERFRRK